RKAKKIRYICLKNNLDMSKFSACASLLFLGLTLMLPIVVCSQSVNEEEHPLGIDSMDQVVITGTMRAVKRSESPVPVEVYTPKFFVKDPSPAIFDALRMVNGVRPQLN